MMHELKIPKMRWAWLMLAAFTLGVLVAAGCNTIEGAGKDIEEGGEEVQDAAD